MSNAGPHPSASDVVNAVLGPYTRNIVAEVAEAIRKEPRPEPVVVGVIELREFQVRVLSGEPL